MARIRTTKPEFWTSEQVVACSPQARLLFIGLWNFCDDYGIHPASHMRLKMEVFPADDFTVKDISNWINELLNNGLLLEYVAQDQKSYWKVTGWKKHQKIDKPTYKFPPPPDNSLAVPGELEEHSPNSLGILEEDSSSTHRIVGESSLTDGKGMEGIGKEEEIFEHWKNVMQYPKATFDKKRRGAIRYGFELGYTVDNLKMAIEGCSKTPFNMGANDKKQKYDSLELIFRDADHIERFIINATSPPSAADDGFEIDPTVGAI